jgi:soluble lytic murein transglycosylase-like protein
MSSKSNTLIALTAILAILMKVAPKVYGAGRPSDPHEFDEYFKRYATYPKIAKAVCRVESYFNPNAVGDRGKAFGLMQIWYPTAQGHGYGGPPYGLLDPEVNIYYATKELNHLIEKYGTYKGIMGYNIGETQLRKGKTNQAYFDKVQDALREITVV